MSSFINLEDFDSSEAEEIICAELILARLGIRDQNDAIGNHIGFVGTWQFERTKCLWLAKTEERTGMLISAAERFRKRWCADVSFVLYGIGRVNLFGTVPLPRRVIYGMYISSPRALADFRQIISGNQDR